MRRGFFALVLFGALTTPAAAAPHIATLSNRADLISGGDALVRVTPAGAQVRLNGADVTSAFAVRPDGRYLGLLEGLKPGANQVRVIGRKGRSARLTITNHSIGGPVTAGPQITPWKCFDGSIDEQCNRETELTYSYKSTAGGPLQPYDPDRPPSDVATTQTDQGKTVPFIVRLETGSIDRDEFRVAALYDPSQPYIAAAPQDGNNHKLLITHGASCDTEYQQAAAPDVMNETALSRGFVVMSNALDNAGHNCNLATQAESLIMTKEHVIDHYGTVRYTIGTGCSGGSLVQQQVANAYPGLYQGITPACSFTDAWSSANQYVDYQLLRRYFETPSGHAPGTVWTPDKIAAVEGHISPANAVSFTTAIPSSGDPSRSCTGVPADQVYDATANPEGVRCSLQDYMVNVFGKDPKTGFALRPYDNVGVQYGLKALLAGTITPTEFVDLNAKTGGWDIDYNPTEGRVAGDPDAITRVYRSGAINQGDNLDEVAIIDLRGPDPGAFHDVYRTYTMRARLQREHGTADNQVLWRGLVPLLGDADYTDEAILAMDAWVGRIEGDGRAVPLARKVLENKPADLEPRCTNGAGEDVDASVCDGAVRAYSDPRQVAGEPEVDDIEKCDLKPVARDDYPGITFTDAQFEQLQKAFPDGVCDWGKDGVGRVETSVWQTYQNADGSALYGGRPLGVPPRSVALRARVRLHRTCATGRLVARVKGAKARSVRLRFGHHGVRGKPPLKVRAGRAKLKVRVVVRLRDGGVIRATRRFPACP